MPSIFDTLFAEGQQHKLYPSVPLDGFRFVIVGVEPYRTWVDSAERKPDGTVKRVPSDELVMDETGERVRCVVSLTMTSPEGLATSASAPFVDRSHYLDEATVRALIELRGHEVGLVRPRIEFREHGKRDDRFGAIETRLAFAFDGFDFGSARGGDSDADTSRANRGSRTSRQGRAGRASKAATSAC